MTTKYLTPDAGPPWTVRTMEGMSGVHVIARDGFTIIATVHDPRHGPMLAAAPDMYEALRALLGAQPGHTPERNRAIALAEAAIAKAEGRDV